MSSGRLQRRYNEKIKINQGSFNIIRLLTKVYNHIEENGLTQGTGFTEGWMCPIYKKKDVRIIVNYRPITLLNTDYKLFMKALSEKLAEVASSIINEDQTGFIKGHNILHPIKLTNLMPKYAEAAQVNGVIVVLDQKKAYNKVTHNYL